MKIGVVDTLMWAIEVKMLNTEEQVRVHGHGSFEFELYPEGGKF